MSSPRAGTAELPKEPGPLTEASYGVTAKQ